ncbi:MAG: hypothetical protein JWP95_1768 [Actinotalea sp.]|nr:hypothetical protein [Actinotalea sp.]
MERPHATRDRIVADAARRSAAEHAQRAAHLARRSAGARRRALLTAVLLLAVVGGWTAVGVAAVPVVAGAAPTVLLAGVLVLGRLAVLAAARADDAWHAGAATRAPLPASLAGQRVVGRSVRPSDASTEVMARVPAPSVQRRSVAADVTADRRAEQAAERANASASAVVDPAAQRDETETSTPGSTWAPVPVPRPAYTLKPSARRAEPAPLDLDQQVTAGQTSAVGSPAAPGERAEKTAALLDPSSPVPVAQPAPFSSTGGIDLDAILARRRASGE